jgi:hypothetical protein
MPHLEEPEAPALTRARPMPVRAAL